VNVGPSRATIIEAGHDFGIRDNFRWTGPGIEAEPRVVAPIPLISGERHTFEVVARTNDDQDRDLSFLWGFITASAEQNGRDASEQLCLVGAVRYRDDNGIIRETGFLRIFDPTRRTWDADIDPGNEYQD
jgi:hypothetical protein